MEKRGAKMRVIYIGKEWQFLDETLVHNMRA